MLRGQPYNRISPMKKDPKKKGLVSVKSVAQRLMDSPSPTKRMGSR